MSSKDLTGEGAGARPVQTNPDRRAFLKGGALAAGAAALTAGSGAPNARATEPAGATGSGTATDPVSDASGDSATAGSGDSDVLRLKSVIAQPDVYFYPGEFLDPNEMRISILGSGMGNLVRRTQAACSIFVELGNGDAFVFDMGFGTLVNYNTLMVPFSRMDKVFISHLHMDHMTDLTGLYAFGPSGGRFTPLRVWGPSGPEPTLGLRQSIEGMKGFTKWHVVSFAAAQPVDQSYAVEINELDYRKNPGVAYEANGVRIIHWPALHTIDGAISYRLDWNGLSFVWSGDTTPNQYLVKNAAGADLIMHATFPTLQRYVTVRPGTGSAWAGNLETSHTSARCLGKILALTQPSLGVTNHCVVDEQEYTAFIDGIRENWVGPYQIGVDFMVFNVSKDQIRVRKAAINERSWGAYTDEPQSTEPALNRDAYVSPALWSGQLSDCALASGDASGETTTG